MRNSTKLLNMAEYKRYHYNTSTRADLHITRSHPETRFRACVTPPERRSLGNCALCQQKEVSHVRMSQELWTGAVELPQWTHTKKSIALAR